MQKKLKNMQNTKNFGLTSNALKIIAIVSMLIDHIGLVFFPEYKIFRIIGRIAFPIFAYMIAEGCYYTKNRKKHLLMIAGLGIVYQIVSAIATGSLYQNILLTFTLAILSVFSIDDFLKKKTKTEYEICFLHFLSCISGFNLPD